MCLGWKSIVWKFLALYDLLEAINIDYQLKYEHATTRRLYRRNCTRWSQVQFDCYEYNYSLIALKCMRLPTNHIALPTTTLLTLKVTVYSNLGTLVNLVTWLLLVQLFFNCIQMHAITYTNPLLPTHLYNDNTQELKLMASLLLWPHSFVIQWQVNILKTVKPLSLFSSFTMIPQRHTTQYTCTHTHTHTHTHKHTHTYTHTQACTNTHS